MPHRGHGPPTSVWTVLGVSSTSITVLGPGTLRAWLPHGGTPHVPGEETSFGHLPDEHCETLVESFLEALKDSRRFCQDGPTSQDVISAVAGGGRASDGRKDTQGLCDGIGDPLWHIGLGSWLGRSLPITVCSLSCIRLVG